MTVKSVRGGPSIPVFIAGILGGGDGGLANLIYPSLEVTGTDQGLTIDDYAAGKTFGTFPEGTTHVFITWDTADVRCTLDGSVPTSSNGHYIPMNSADIWPIAWVGAAKFIRVGAASGYAHATPLRAS